MLIERRLKWQRYGFRHEVEDGYRGENFCAKKYPDCRAVYLMTSVSREIQGLEILSPSRSLFPTLTRPSRFSMPTYLTIAVEVKVT